MSFLDLFSGRNKAQEILQRQIEIEDDPLADIDVAEEKNLPLHVRQDIRRYKVLRQDQADVRALCIEIVNGQWINRLYLLLAIALSVGLISIEKLKEIISWLA